VDSLPKYLSDKLLSRNIQGITRTLKRREGLIDFCSNDYLGLAASGSEEKAIESGSGGSRLLSGNKKIFEETESFLASFFNSPSALLFNSGYDANLGLLSCISERHSTFLFDEYAHASIRDGLRLGNGKAFHFRHNDLKDLERLLKIGGNRLFVVTESLFSMDGDLAPLEQIAGLCKKYKASLIVDEAHATGIFGDNGEGCVSERGLEGHVFARIHTFGKAVGIHGAAILGSVELRNYLINFCRPFIYSTALPPSTVSKIKTNIQSIINDPSARMDLEKIISYFNKITGGTQPGPIKVILPGGGNDTVRRISSTLENSGLDVPGILSPTVPKGKERLRICLHSFNSTGQVDALAEALKSGGISSSVS